MKSYDEACRANAARGLTESIDRLVESAPPLSERQKQIIRDLLMPPEVPRASGPEVQHPEAAANATWSADRPTDRANSRRGHG